MTGNRHVRFWSRAGRGDPPGLGSGRVGNHRLYPEADGPQRRLCEVFPAFSPVGRSSAGAFGPPHEREDLDTQPKVV